MKPSLLTRSLSRAYPELKNKDFSFSKHRENAFKNQRLGKSSLFFKQTSVLVKASYKVFPMIAQQKKAYIIGKNFALPAAKRMVRSIWEMSQ